MFAQAVEAVAVQRSLLVKNPVGTAYPVDGVTQAETTYTIQRKANP